MKKMVMNNLISFFKSNIRINDMLTHIEMTIWALCFLLKVVSSNSSMVRLSPKFEDPVSSKMNLDLRMSKVHYLLPSKINSSSSTLYIGLWVSNPIMNVRYPSSLICVENKEVTRKMNKEKRYHDDPSSY